MSNFKGEIRIEALEHGSNLDPVIIPCSVNDVHKLQYIYSKAPEMLDQLIGCLRALEHIKTWPSGRNIGLTDLRNLIDDLTRDKSND